jgi:tetratricopeptide (TPR) repeat protein
MKLMRVAVFALSALLAAYAAPDSIESRINAGEYSAALAALNSVPDQNRDARWHLLASKAQDGLNNPGGAVAEAQQAIDLDPGSEAARLQLAQIFLSRNTPEAAYEILSEAMPLFPNSALLRLGAGLALNQMRRYADAIGVLNKCLQMRPELGPAFDALASAYLNSAGYEPLLKESAEYSRAHPDDFRGFYYEAAARVELALEPASAEALLRRSIQLNPSFAAAHALLGRILVDRNQAEAAVPELKQAIHLRPDYTPAHLYLARAWRKLGKADLAREESETVARLNQEESRPVPHLLYHRGSRPAQKEKSETSAPTQK